MNRIKMPKTVEELKRTIARLKKVRVDVSKIETATMRDTHLVRQLDYEQQVSSKQLELFLDPQDPRGEWLYNTLSKPDTLAFWLQTHARRR